MIDHGTKHLHGPHHGAQKSTSTGTSLCNTESKFSALTTITFSEAISAEGKGRGAEESVFGRRLKNLQHHHTSHGNEKGNHGQNHVDLIRCATAFSRSWSWSSHRYFTGHRLRCRRPGEQDRLLERVLQPEQPWRGRFISGPAAPGQELEQPAGAAPGAGATPEVGTPCAGAGAGAAPGQGLELELRPEQEQEQEQGQELELELRPEQVQELELSALEQGQELLELELRPEQGQEQGQELGAPGTGAGAGADPNRGWAGAAPGTGAELELHPEQGRELELRPEQGLELERHPEQGQELDGTRNRGGAGAAAR